MTDVPTAAPVDGGTVRVAWDRRPDTLNPVGTAGAAARRLLEPVLLGAYVQRPDLSFAPQLLSAEAEVTAAPSTVTYWIDPDARWSDGTPVTSADFAYTARLNRAEPGYSLITAIKRMGPKRVRLTFQRPYAAYRTLFDPILPAHVAPPSQWDDQVPVASGPFEFDQWERGAAILKRNENYWGEPSHLDEVLLVPADDDPAFLLAEQRVDVVDVPADADVAERVRALSGVVAKLIPSGTAQVLLLNDDRWPLRNAQIRQAVALAVDRSTLVQQLVADAFPDTQPLHSLLSIPAGDAYTPDFELFDDAEDEARALLDKVGCPQVGGSRRCRGRPLVLRYPAQPTGTPAQIQWQLLAGDLADIGVAAEPVAAGQIDLDVSTWTWPWSEELSNAYACRQGAPGCRPGVTRALAALDRAVGADAVSPARVQAAAALTESPRVLPLYMRPQLTAWHQRVSGVQGSAADESLLWNAGEWFVRP